MNGTPSLDDLAAATLERLRARGFEQVQVTAADSARCELNVAHNEPSLMRSNESRKLAATGIVDGRRASADTDDVSAPGVEALVDGLWHAAASAPRDEANAVSQGQKAVVRRGAAEADPAALARALRELLDWRSAEVPGMMIEEALAAHRRVRSRTLTSGGSELACELGWCELSVFGLARDGEHTSSFNHAGGTADALLDVPSQFGVDRMMRELVRQTRPQPLPGPFTGDVVLSPGAVCDLLDWFMGQLDDAPLIDGSSLYRERVGQGVASSLLTVKSRYDAPGCVPLTADAFLAPAVTLLDRGRLTQLTPSYYGSRKTGVPHKPVAGSGWELLPGDTPLEAMVAGVPRGALVDRLSMGSPAPNGDFSGVIKNSFLIEDGGLGPALAETMINGNVARMLLDVLAVSTERLDSGSLVLPWVRIGGLHFS